MMRMSWAWALAFAGLGVSLAACKFTPAPAAMGSGGDGGSGGAAAGGGGSGGSGGAAAGGGGSGGSTGSGTGSLPTADLHKLCCREPLEWLRTPEHRHTVPNHPCGDPQAPICFGQAFYEIITAYAVTHDRYAPPIPPDLLTDALLLLESKAIAGEPVQITGCADPNSCEAQYGSDWDDAAEAVMLKLHPYDKKEMHAAWLQSIAPLDPPAFEVESGDDLSAVVSSRLAAGRPSFLALDQPMWTMTHAVLVVRVTPLAGDRVALEYYDANKPEVLRTMECSKLLKDCLEYKPDDGDPATPPVPHIEDGALWFVVNGVRYNDYVDLLAWQREATCGDYAKGEGPRHIPVALDVQYTSGTTVWKEDGSSETLWSINKHRFVLDEDAKHVKEQLVRHQVVQGGEQVTMLDVWAKATGMIDRYMLTPLVFNPAGQPAVMKTLPIPVNEDIWSPPVSPGLNDILLDCLEGELDACMESHGLTLVGDSSVNGMPCRDYNLVELGTGYDVCVTTVRCTEEAGLLLPVRLRSYAGDKVVSEIALSDVWSPVFPPETFKVPEDCVPAPQAPGVEFCAPPG